MAVRREEVFEDRAVFNQRIVDLPPNEFDAAVTAVFDDGAESRGEPAVVSSEPAVVSDEPAITSPVINGEPVPSAEETEETEVLQPGERLRGRYEIVEHVHSGGMSHVYKAVDLRRRWNETDAQYVAIKTMRNPLINGVDDRALEREATKTMQLTHPNVVTVHDYDQHEDQFFIVMEWLYGESLNDLLRRTQGRRLVPEFADRIIEGVISGIAHAHGQNIVHADLNPANVFITDVQEIKVLDFGVARYADDAQSSPEVPEAWATVHYASPQVLSRLTPTKADDVFALACLIYRLKTGRLPFMGVPSVDAWRNGDEVVPPAKTWRSAFDPVLDGLAYERAKRPRTVAAFSAQWSMEKCRDRMLRPPRNRVSESKWLDVLQQRTR